MGKAAETSWLPEQPKRRAAKKKSPAKKGRPKATEWLEVPTPAAPAKKKKKAKGAPRGGERTRRQLEGRVRALRKEVVDRDATIAELTARIAQLEGKRTPSRRRNDINTATFEDLREFGLSVTQSARLIAHREMQGGLDSIDDVGRLNGFSRTTVQELKARFR